MASTTSTRDDFLNDLDTLMKWFRAEYDNAKSGAARRALIAELNTGILDLGLLHDLPNEYTAQFLVEQTEE